MANLSVLGLDPDIPENEGGFTVIPAGEYKAVILTDNFKNNKSNTGKILELKLQIIEGEHKGVKLPDYLNITNKEKISEKIGQGTLKRICRICRIEYPPADTSHLHGKLMLITVSVQEFKSNKTDKMIPSNKINAYNQISDTVIVSDKTKTKNNDNNSDWD